MKLKVTSLVLGICLAVLASAANPAFARSTTAFSAFRVWEQFVNQYNNPLGCLTEYYGAVVNNCPYSVNLEFDLPVDTAGMHTITVQNWWHGTDKSELFSCESSAYPGSSDSNVVGDRITFGAPGESYPSNVYVYPGWSIQVVCWDVPPNGGVANFNWNP